MNHRNLLFDPEVFREPHKFRPERWLDEAHPIDEKRYFVVFGKGTRNCPGKEYVLKLADSSGRPKSSHQWSAEDHLQLTICATGLPPN